MGCGGFGAVRLDMARDDDDDDDEEDDVEGRAAGCGLDSRGGRLWPPPLGTRVSSRRGEVDDEPSLSMLYLQIRKGGKVGTGH